MRARGIQSRFRIGRATQGSARHRFGATSGALLILLSSFGFIGSLALPKSVEAAPPSSVTEFQPTLNATNGPGLTKWGGRSVSITVKPGDDNTVIAATEGGGLFRTTNGGSDWSHLDGLVPFRMADVEYSPSNSSVVIATSFTSGDTAFPGGIWRSADGGTTWSQSASAAGLCAQPFSAWGVAYEPSSNFVYAGTDCGLALSSDGGATWSLATGAPAPAVALVAAHSASNGTIDVCAPDGHRRYTRSGSTLTLVNGPVALGGGTGGCRTPWIHDLAGVPGDPNVLFAMDTVTSTSLCGGTVPKPAGAWQLFRTTDGGATWAAADAQGIMCPSRPPQVATHASRSGTAGEFDIYFSGSLDVQRQTCTSGGGGNRCTGVVGNGPNITIPHADTSQTVFENGSGNCALYMVSDGGATKSSDCGATFVMVGGSGAGGYNALQLYEGISQFDTGNTTTRLYFGTQDNDVWAADLGSAAGTTFNTVRGVCCEGFFFQTPRQDSGSTQIVNAVVCSGCNNVYFNTLYSGSGYNPGGSLWNEPPEANNGNPFLITEGVYLETVHPDVNAPTGAGDEDPYKWYVGVLGTLGNPGTITWTRATVDGTNALTTNNLRGRPWISGPAADPTVYQAYCRSSCGSNAENEGLYRITGLRSGTASATVVDAGLPGGIGSYCNGQGTFVCPVVFGVNPNNPLELIATERVGSTDLRMRKSSNGGNTWTTDAALTSLVKLGTRFRGWDPNTGSQVHAIAWDPDDPAGNRILVGTEGAGVAASFDGGATWSHLGGSERATAISSFVFGNPAREGTLITTYGRGIWKLAIPKADLAITKSHHPDPAIAGTQLYYDLTVTNNGPEDTATTTVVDTLPPEVRYVTNTLPDPSACTVNSSPPGVSQVVTCELGPIANGDSVSFTMKADVLPAAIANTGPRGVTNTATVLVGGAVDPNSADNTATDTVIIEDSADLQVTKVCTPNTTILAGNAMDCSIFVDNNGPSTARAIVVDDTMLSDGTFTVSNESPTLGGGTPGCTLTLVTGGQRLTCRLGNLDPKSTPSTGRATMTYRITATEGMDIDNVAVARSDTPDPQPGNNTVTVPLTFTAVADLSIVKTAPASRDAGTNLTWTINVGNTGPSTAKNVVVKDVLPPGVDYISATVTTGPGSCTAGVPGDAAQPVTCGLGSMGPGTGRTIQIVAKIQPDTTGVLGNDARVSSDTLDLNSANNFTHSDTAVNVNVGLELTMVASPNPVASGTIFTVRSTALNNGPSTAKHVVLDLVLPPDTTYAGSTLPSGGTCGLLTVSQLRCNLPNLAPGATADVFVDLRVASKVEGGVTLITNGTLTATGASPVSASVFVDSTRVADLGVVLTSDALVYKPSKIIHYSIVMTNNGPSDSSGVTFTLNLPPPKSAIYDSNNSGCPSPVGTTMTCNIGILRAGETKTVIVNVLIRGNKGTITSSVSIVSNGNGVGSPPSSDPVSGNNTSTRVVTVK